MSISSSLENILKEQLSPGEQDLPCKVTVSKHSDADFQSNVAFIAAKHRRQKPLDCATHIIDNIAHEDYEFSCSPPGFINITVKASKYKKILQNLETFIKNKPPTEKKIIVDYSSPNVAKEFHVGHLRSTVIGDCLANALQWLGHDVLRLNHIGDWGTAFGMLIAFIKDKGLEVKLFHDQATLSDLMQWYRESKQLFDNDQQFYHQSKKQVVALQQGCPNNIKLWQRICDLSAQSYNQIYARLSISDLQERGESFYNDYLQKIVDDCQNSGIAVVDNGAVCVFLEGFVNRENHPLPLIVQKSDGGFNYATTDLAALYHRFNCEKVDQVFYVTDSGQRQHFEMVFQAGYKLGYIPTLSAVHHVPFGLVLDKNKKKFKTRSGDTIKLTDLLDEGYHRALGIAQERGLTKAELFAKTVGIGAIKYADLSHQKISDYVFDFDKMLSFEGNTIVYILYAFVRVQSLKRKFAWQSLENIDISLISNDGDFTSYEQALLLQLDNFELTIVKVAHESSPNILTDYLYNLANDFHSFFQHCPIKDSQYFQKRLYLAHHVGLVLEKGLDILGCGVIDEM